MGLGIVLHAAIPFVPFRRGGTVGDDVLDHLFLFIHGFRMPLFFLLSGFFTAMLWRRRGLGPLVRHRLRRVGLPLLVSLGTILPAVWVTGVVGYVVADVAGVLDLDDAASIEDVLDDDSVLARLGAAVDDTAPADEDDGFGFAHLWFLWFLLWLVAGFAVVAWPLRRLWPNGWPRGPTEVVRWLLIPAAVGPQLLMREPVFGPDTSEGLLPEPQVLAFYALFFAFGAMSHAAGDGPTPLERIGRWWWLQAAIGAALYPLVIAWMIDGAAGRAAVGQVAFAWLVSFALIGAFRRYLAGERFRVRYLSDASYWLYLTHLPLVLLLQGVFTLTPLPPLLETSITVAVTVALLLVVYGAAVRYSAVGTLLNGQRTRPADDAARRPPPPPPVVGSATLR